MQQKNSTFEKGAYFSDYPSLHNHHPYKISKITIYFATDRVLGVKANYYSSTSMTTVTGKSHKWHIIHDL
jgi:hypothetical protein